MTLQYTYFICLEENKSNSYALIIKFNKNKKIYAGFNENSFVEHFKIPNLSVTWVTSQQT